MSDCCESASGQVVSGNPLMSPRDRDIFSLEQENTVSRYSMKIDEATHDAVGGGGRHFMAVIYVGHS